MWSESGENKAFALSHVKDVTATSTNDSNSFTILPFRRKKKCIRYLAGEDGDESGGSDDDADDASKVDSTTTDGDLESMGSPMRMPASSASGSSDHEGRSAATTGSGIQNATVSSVTSSAASSTSKSSSNSSTSFTSAHPIGFSPVAPSRPGVNHPIEKLCGGSTPPPQLQRPPGHPSQSRDLAAATHRQYGVPGSSSLAASSPIVPALIAT